MVLLFSLIVWRKAALLNTPLLVFLGTVSYPLYLLHQNIGYVIIQRMRNHGFAYGWAILLAFGVSLAVATAVTFGIERPVQRRVRLWRERRLSRGRPLDVARPL